MSRNQKGPKKKTKFIVYSLFLLGLVVWSGSYWWLLLELILIDQYITQRFNWTFWKKRGEKPRGISGWADAIIYATVLATILRTFLLEAFLIPTPSMENTLKVGDFLFVSKFHYGPRVPNTPLSFPFVHHTMPFTTSTSSYLEWLKWDYERLPGLTEIERNDIIVFNFPAGDTIIIGSENPDYYTQVKTSAYGLYMQSGKQNSVSFYESMIKRKLANQIKVRPVDKREHYVKRGVGMPGDSLEIVDGTLYVNGEYNPELPIKYNDTVFFDIPVVSVNLKKSHLDYVFVVDRSGEIIDKGKVSEVNPSKSRQTTRIYYAEALETLLQQEEISDENLVSAVRSNMPNSVILPLEEKRLGEVRALPHVTKITRYVSREFYPYQLYPHAEGFSWTEDNYGPLWIPRRGDSVRLTKKNLQLYSRVINAYEGNSISVKDSLVYINNKVESHYVFKMNYYWLMGDNRHNSADSRSWGFVPENHIVGTPLFIWMSWDSRKNQFPIRFSRLLQSVD